MICSPLYLIVDKIKSELIESYPNIDSFTQFTAREYPNIGTGRIINSSTKDFLLESSIGSAFSGGALAALKQTAEAYEDGSEEQVAYMNKRYAHLLESLVEED